MQPQLKNYLDVHQYLKDYYFYRKTLRRTFTYEVWSREIGVRDRSYLRAVVLGIRPLNDQLIEAIKKKLFKNERDQNHFRILAYYSQAKSKEQKNIFGQELLQYCNEELQQAEIKDNYEFLSNPLVPRLQTLVSYEDCPTSMKDLAECLKTDEGEIKAALETLERLELIQKAPNSVYKAKNSAFKVDDVFMSVGLRVFYENSFEDARKAIDLPKADRRFKTYYIAMNDQEFAEILEEFHVFMRAQMQKRNYQEVAGRKLFQLQMSAFAASNTVQPGPVGSDQNT